MTLRVFIAGQRAFGAAVYTLCQNLGLDIAGVCAPPLSTTGRYPDRLRALAEEDGVPWLPAGQLREDTLPVGVDVILAAHSHDFIGRRTRLKARLGALGYHPSLLPRHRGRDAIRWAIHLHEPVTGGSVYWLNDTVDGGDLAAQDWCFIRPEDTPEELWRRDLFPMGRRLFGQVLQDLMRGVVVAIPQDQALATWEPSWGRAPLYRPELPLLGQYSEDVTLIKEREALEALRARVGVTV